MNAQEHYCRSVDAFPDSKFIQIGFGRGEKVLILGEAPAPNGWRKSGKAFYTIDGKLLPTGKNLNKLLSRFGLSVEICGFTELVKCYVGKNRNLLYECGQKCWPIFLRQMKRNDFSLVIILGVKTLEIFNNLLGTKLTIGKLSRTVVIGDKNYHILPIYHPSPIAPFNHEKNKKIFNGVKKRLEALL